MSLQCGVKVDSTLKEATFSEEERRVIIMKGKVLSIITAILFGVTMLAAPIVVSAQDTGSAAADTVKPAKKSKKKTTKKKAVKKPAKKKATKKKGTKKAADTKA